MLKYSDIYNLREPTTIVIFNESLRTFAYILPVGQCTPDANVSYVSDVMPSNSMAYISKTGPTISFKYFFMGTSWVALSIKKIKTPASREMTSRKLSKQIFDFNGVNVTKHCHVTGYLPC